MTQFERLWGEKKDASIAIGMRKDDRRIEQANAAIAKITTNDQIQADGWDDSETACWYG